MIEVTAALASIKTATEIAKMIREGGLTLKDAEAKMRLAELVGALADARLAMADVQESLLDRDVQIRALEEKLALRGKMVFEQPLYYLVDGSLREGPYCQPCYDSDGKLVRLQGTGDGYWLCQVCKNPSIEKRYHDRQEAAMRSSAGDSDPYAF